MRNRDEGFLRGGCSVCRYSGRPTYDYPCNECHNRSKFTSCLRLEESDERDKETVGVKKMGISKTADMMCSSDYKDRFIAEYLQLRYRYEKLRMFNARIKAAAYAYKDELMPKHDCPDTMLFDQERAMEEYMRILEGRAVIEGIDLEEALEKFYETN